MYEHIASLLVGESNMSLMTACVPSHVFRVWGRRKFRQLLPRPPSASQAEPSRRSNGSVSDSTPVQPRFHEGWKVIEPRAAVIPDNYDLRNGSALMKRARVVPLYDRRFGSRRCRDCALDTGSIFRSFTDTEVGRSFEGDCSLS